MAVDLEPDEAWAADAAALLKAISDGSGDAIFAKDRAGRLRFANPATLALIGKPLEAVLGNTDLEILEDAEAAREVMRNDAEVMESGVARELEERVPLPGGAERIWLSRKAPYRDASGRVLGLLGISRDITARKRAERERDRLARQRQLALDAARMGWWRYEPEARAIAYDARAGEIFGVSGGRLAVQAFLRLVHPPDVSRVWAAIRAALDAGDPRPYSIAYRVERPDGTLRWVEAHGVAEFEGEAEARRATSFVGTVADVTDRKRAEEELRDADRRKDMFLGMLSHELRNPLAPIRNSIYLLRQAQPGAEQVHRAHEVIERQTEHLTRLIDDLLDVTRIASGKVRLRRTRLDLREVARRAAEDFRSVLEERGIALHAALPEGPVWADADPTRLTQVIGNLLSNAAKFTRRGDTVALALQASGDEAELRVRDTGAGIEPGLLARVFDPFVQGERTLARTEGGLGLGLALVKGIAELHGGSARAASAGKGLGAEFAVRLPLAAPEAPPAAAAAAPARGPGARRVLVVDDNRDAADSLAEIVRLLGHEAEVAYDGPSALEQVLARLPDVVLCDLGLPGLSGYDLARRVRAAGHAHLLLVAVSGYAQPEDVRAALEAGFDQHLAKPAALEDVERLLA